MEARVVIFVPHTTPNPRSYGTEPKIYVYMAVLVSLLDRSFMFTARIAFATLGSPSALLLPLLALTAIGCGKESRRESATTSVLATAAVDTMSAGWSMPRGGMGTGAAHRMIIDSLGPIPSLAFHRMQQGAEGSEGAIAVTDRASGTSFRIVPQSAWTLRDVEAIRLDVQEDSTALVVLLLARTRATEAFLAATAQGDNDGALLVNGQVLRLGAGAYFGTGEVPVPLGPFLRSDAEQLATRLRAARAQYTRPS